MRDWTIPSEISHFQVINKAWRVPDERKCENEGGIVQSRILDYV